MIMVFAMLLAMTVAFAQRRAGSVTGRLVGKQSGSPLEYASVALRDASSHRIVNGTMTDTLGIFKIDGIKRGNYELQCSYVGCADYVTPAFSVTSAKPAADFKDIVLDDSSMSLAGSVVSAKRSTYVQSIDKKVFTVGSDIMSGSGAVSELLQNIPSVQVDIEGNVSLRGNENVQVLIDGKPSVLMRGVNRGTVLQQLPASSIDRIEVITNPSAQYKPDGTSGIINLIMKKERTNSFKGSVTLNAGNQGRYNAGVTLGWSTPKFGLTANYGYRIDRRDRWTKNDRTLTDSITGDKTVVNQYVDSRARSQSHIGGLALQWNPTLKDAFELSGSYTYMTFPRIEDNTTTQLNGTCTTKQFTRHRADNEMQQEAEGSASYTHTFREGHSLMLDYTLAFQDEIERNKYTNTYTIPADSIAWDMTTIRQRTYENLIRLIYTNKLDDRNSIVAGYEAELDRSPNYYYAADSLNGSWVKNTLRSNDFLFNENVHSLYATWEHTMNDFSFMAGLRGEQSFITSNLLTLNQKVNDNYFLLYPTLHTAYKLDGFNELQLNYSLRVNRPEGDDLNPFPEYQDLYNIRAGNPYLRPEKIHSVEFGWQYKQGPLTFIMTPYFRYTFNKMTEITKVLSDGVIMTTKQNMSSSSDAGVEAVVNSGIGNWCTFNLSTNLYYNTIDATDLGYSAKRAAWAWYASLNADFTPIRNLMLQVNTRYNSSVLTPQGKRLGMYIMNLGAKYDIPRYNISLTATVSDLFDSYKTTRVIDTPYISQTIQMRRAPRIFYFGINFRFGENAKQADSHKLSYDEPL